jgi:hypothetical protein
MCNFEGHDLILLHFDRINKLETKIFRVAYIDIEVDKTLKLLETEEFVIRNISNEKDLRFLIINALN